MLLGFSAGGAVSSGGGIKTSPHFKVGTGLDWLQSNGLLIGSRLETTHLIDSSLSLQIGWAGRGLRAEQGLPLAFTLGGVGAIARDGVVRAGGRGQVALGLWYSRALLEFDVTLRRRLTDDGDRELFEPEVIVGLTLRVVPWSPFRL